MARTSRNRMFTALGTVALSLALISPAAPGSADPAPPPRPGSQEGTTSAGPWQVQRVAPATYRVSWRSPSRLPTGSDRPSVVGSGDREVGTSTVAADGRTVSALVRSPEPPEPADFDVVLSGDRLDAPGDDRITGGGTAPGSDATEPRQRSADVTPLDVDPGRRGELETVSSDYRLRPVKLPGMRKPIEMVGHVVEPAPGALTSPAPLVLFQHGRHEVCYKPAGRPGRGGLGWPCRAPYREIPSHLGYDYVQRLLASQGYVTVSVRVNGINAQDFGLADGGANARAQIIARHLDHWVDLAPKHQVDLEQVVLVGHSRGGEGVDRASIQIPASAPYRIAGQVLIAPTNFGSQTAPYVPTVTLLPSCDGDVFDLQGQRYTDVARDVSSNDTSLKSSVMVLGANHNFFNTEWTPGKAAAPASDDWFGPAKATCGKQNPARLPAGEQRRVSKTYVAGAVRLFTGEQDLLPMFDGSRVRLPSAGDARVLSHAIGGGRDVRRPASDATLSLAEGARTSFCRGVSTNEPDYGKCGRRIGSDQVTPQWISGYERAPSRRFFQMSWRAAGQRGGMQLETPLDLSTDRLELRTLVDPRIGPVRLDVRLTDGDGASAQVQPEGPALLRPVQRGTSSKTWGQTLVVDSGQLSGIDRSRVTTVELVSRNRRGRVWVADLSAAPATLAPVPDRRAATIEIDNVAVPGEDDAGSVTARVPLRIQGLTEPARVLVTTTGSSSRDRSRYLLFLAAGQTSASVPVVFKVDRDDDRRQTTSLVLYPISGVMTDGYNAKVRFGGGKDRGR